MTGPLVSVVIPTFNRAAFVVEAINSCLAQDFPRNHLEIIVVDDGSTDDTAVVLKCFSEMIRYFPLSNNQGRNKARNTGLALANGIYVKFLDSDDVLVSGSLQIELAAAQAAGADIVVSGCKSVELSSDRSERLIACFDPPFMEPIVDSLLAGKAVPTSAALYSRALIDTMTWDEGLRKLDDWDWFIRAALRAKIIVRTDVVSYSWRQHPGQGTRSDTMLRNALEHHIILRKLEAALAERRLLTKARRQRLAQYLYKELRVLCLWDKAAFDQGVRHIYKLDPEFVPRDEERQWWMRALCRVLGVRYAVLLHCGIKRFVKNSIGGPLND
jgi:glycosyltransferase involved in cell wall biosynthesis